MVLRHSWCMKGAWRLPLFVVFFGVFLAILKHACRCLQGMDASVFDDAYRHPAWVVYHDGIPGQPRQRGGADSDDEYGRE